MAGKAVCMTEDKKDRYQPVPACWSRTTAIAVEIRRYVRCDAGGLTGNYVKNTSSNTSVNTAVETIKAASIRGFRRKVSGVMAIGFLREA